MSVTTYRCLCRRAEDDRCETRRALVVHQDEMQHTLRNHWTCHQRVPPADPNFPTIPSPKTSFNVMLVEESLFKAHL